MSEVIDFRRLPGTVETDLFPAPPSTVVKLFGQHGLVHVYRDRIYGTVAQPDGTFRFGWIHGGELRMAPVRVVANTNVVLVRDGTAALFVDAGGYLVEVPLDGGAPRPLFGLGRDPRYDAGADVAVLTDGWYAVREELSGGVTLLRPGGPTGALHDAGTFPLPHADSIRAALDGRVVLVDADEVLVVLGFADGRLRELARVTRGFEFLQIPLDASGYLIGWPSEPYCWHRSSGLTEIVGLEPAWAAASAADSTIPDLTSGETPTRTPEPFQPVPPVGETPAPGSGS